MSPHSNMQKSSALQRNKNDSLSITGESEGRGFKSRCRQFQCEISFNLLTQTLGLFPWLTMRDRHYKIVNNQLYKWEMNLVLII